MRTDTADKFTFSVSRTREIVFFVLIFSLAVFLRFYLLSADSPNGISFSQGIETDPPQYTVHARSAELTGEWNPYQDYRHITYQYSLVSGLSRIVYGLFGTGFYWSNITGVILSLASLLLFYFVLRKSLGNAAALLALLFISINYLGIFFGRRPFLENGMNFLLILSLFILTYAEEKVWGHLLFGAVLGATIVYGKIIGLAFLAVPAVYYLMRLFYLGDKKTIVLAAFWAVGFAAVAGSWYKLIYLPHAAELSGYVEEQALGLYGAPTGLKSVSNFVWQFLSFGKHSDFFGRMPTISITALVGLIILAGRIWYGKDDLSAPRYRNLIVVSIAVWLIGTYLAQMPWNYRPVRYQTTMIFPLAALTAAATVYIYRLTDKFNPLNGSLRFNLFLLVVVLLFLHQVNHAVFDRLGFDLAFNQYILYMLAVVTVVVGGYFAMSLKKQKIEYTMPPFIRYYLIAAVIIISIGYQGLQYVAWAKTPIFTTRQASLDLGRVLSPDAVISGPYAPALAMENDLGCVIHIFGTSRPDTTLFQRLPVTHLVLERSNESVARELYPKVMEKAHLVCHYYVNCRKISIYRIAFNTGNRQAARYFPSSFETAVRAFQLDMPDTGHVYLDRFQRINPDNLSGHLQQGYMSFKDGDIDRAVELFKRAISFAPTDFDLHYLLARAYITLADSLDNDSLRQLGERETALATRYNLGYYDFDDHIMDELFEDNSNE